MSIQDKDYHIGIATTILNQFGGKKALNMIGGKPAMGSNDGNAKSAVPMGNEGDTIVDIKFEAEAKEIDGVAPNVARIIYCNGSDTYNMVFFNATGTMARVLKEYDDVYCDMLQDLFEDTTGLFLTFHPRG